MNEKIKMVLIATYPKMAEIFLQLADLQKNIEGKSVYASFERAVEIAKEMEKNGEADVILSRGGTAAQIKNAVDLPVVFIPITPFDVIQVVHQLEPDVKKVAFIHYMKNVYGVQEIAKMYGIEIIEYPFINYFDIEDAVHDAYEKNIQCIIGGEVAARIAKKLGMKGYQVSAGKEAVERAMAESLSVLYEKRKEQKRAMQSKTAYDSLKEGIIVTDDEERIVIINPVAGKLYDNRYKVGDIAGKDIIDRECREVYVSHKEVPVYLKKYRQGIYATTHFPIIQNGRFIGVVNRYEDVTKTQELEQKIRKELHQKGFVAKYHFEDIITKDEGMKKVLQRAKVYAKTDSAVLIEGESGTGKELLAQSIHNESRRRERPFVAVNCAAIPDNLLESELFGYEPGAFTGAKKEGKAGLFELAHQGTLFLDEIGEIPKNLQTRLLRVLQEKEIMRVGGNKIIPVDVRIISATNQNLKEKSKEGTFREDLYYRLNVLQLKVPPLRKRCGDVTVLAENFLKSYYSGTIKMEHILPVLNSYSWPGNIRELQNIMERYGVLLSALGEDAFAEEEILDIFGNTICENGANKMEIEIELGGELADIIKKVEYEVTNRYLEEFDHNQELAAKALGIGRTTFWRKSKGIGEKGE